MWKVFFEHVGVFTSKNDVEALEFAISLHKVSNVAHRIDVVELDPKTYDVLGVGAVCTLIRE